MGQKLKFVLSDLHIGAGRIGEQRHYPDNFLADDEFANFLQTISLESERDNREVELIINGDFLDFLRLPAVDDFNPTEIYPKETFLDSSKEASIKRLNIIYQGHKRVFEALTHFMRSETPKRRLTIIKGSHDVHFYWPRVKSRLRELLNASGTRASLLLFAEEFVSREKIYVEHGHQQAEKINRYVDFRDPIRPDNPTQIIYPDGSHLAINLHCDIGPDYPFVGTITPITTLIWLALKWDPPLAAKLLVHIGQQIPSPVLDVSGPDDMWQVLRNEETSFQALQQSLDDITLRRQLYHSIRRCLHYMSADEVSAPPTFSDDVTHDDPLTMAQISQDQSRTKLALAAARIAGQEGAQAILFGFSHQATQKRLKNGAVYINTGCWAQDFSAASSETWQAIFERSGLHGKLPNEIPAKLPYARIDYDEADTPSAQLLDFAAQGQVGAKATKGLSQKVMGWLFNKWRS